MAKNEFRFSIRKNATTYYAINGSNVVEQVTPFYPEGIGDVEGSGIKNGRNRTYGGYNRTYSGKLKFTLEAAKILADVIIKAGISTKPFLYIEKLNSKTLQYEDFISVEFNPRTISYDFQRVEIQLLQYGIEGLIKDNENVRYDIEMTDSISSIIRVPSQYLQGNVLYYTAWPTPDASNTSSKQITTNTYLPYLIKGTETIVEVAQGSNKPIATPKADKDHDYIDGQAFQTGAGYTTGGLNFLLKAEVELTNVIIKGNIGMYVENETQAPGYHHLALGLTDDSGVLDPTPLYTLQSPLLPYPVVSGSGTLFTYSIDTSAAPLTIPAGKKLILAMWMDNSVTTQHNVTWEDQNEISINFWHHTSAFEFKAVRIWRVLEALVKKMTNNLGSFESAMFKNNTETAAMLQKYYDTIPYSAWITCGDAIRGINSPGYNNPVMKPTFRDAFNFASTQFNAGMGTEGNTVRMEDSEYFFNDIITSTVFTEWEGYRPKIIAVDEYYYNTVEAGSENQDYDGLNGRYEYNCGSSLWALPTNDGGSNVLDLKTSWRTDPTGIFLTWAQYKPDESKDSESDNDIFVIDAVWDGTLQKHVPRKLSGTISGIPDPSGAYNIAYSPKHKLWRNGSRLRIGLIGKESGYITMLSAERNRNLFCYFGNGPFHYGDEDEAIKVGDLNKPLFRPYMVELSVISQNSYNTLMTNVNTKWGKHAIYLPEGNIWGFPAETSYTFGGIDKYQLFISYSTSLESIINNSKP